MRASERPKTEVLLPFSVGLLQVGLLLLGPNAAITTGLNIVAFLALGAVLPARPWRTAAIASVPGLVFGLVRAGLDSSGTFLMVFLASPLVVAFSAVLVKGGAMLVARAGDEPTADPTGVAGASPRRRKAFETKAQRGRFLVVLVLVLVIAGTVVSRWGGREADSRAAARADQIQAALAGVTAQSLQVDSLTGAMGEGPGPPGGAYNTQSLRPTASEPRPRSRCGCSTAASGWWSRPRARS